MTVSPDIKPPLGGCGGAVHDWERSLDPWHADAFPDEFKGAALSSGKRKTGWMALDAFSNPVAFVPDGTIMP